MAPHPQTNALVQQLEHRYGALHRALGHGLTHGLALRRLGGRPPVLWHGAHILEAMHSTLEAAVLGLGGAPLGERFSLAASRDSTLADQAQCGLQELRQQLQVSSSTLLDELKSLTPEDLGSPPLVAIHPAFSGTLRSRRVWLDGHVFHVAYHLGAIGMLRAEWGLGS